MRHSNTDDRTSRLNLLGGLRSVAMAGCLLGFALFLWPTGDNPSRGESIASSEMRLASSRSNAPGAPLKGHVSSRWTQPIETIEVGQRVLANNPEVFDSERATWKTPAWSQWLHLSLVMPKPDGQELHIELLRDEGWVLDSMFAIGEANSDPAKQASDAAFKLIHWQQQTVAYTPVRPVFRQIRQLAAEANSSGTALVGLAVEMDLPELGITGPAFVTEIMPCPAVAEGDGQVVTATFHHSSGDILDLTVGDDTGATETLGTTSNHPFWSEDRQDYIQAGMLEIGERLLTYHGDTKRVITKLARPGPEPVYNLEVFGEHVYYVGQLGTLVHNSYGNASSQGAIPNRLLRRQPDIDHVRGGSVADWEVRNGQFFSGGTPVHFGKARMNAQEGIDFVIGVDGKLLLGNRHTFLAGLGGDATQALAAGTLRLKQGRISSITNLSGHFNPRVHEAKRYPELFKKAGFDVSGAGLEIYVPKSASGIERYTGGVQLHRQTIIP